MIINVSKKDSDGNELSIGDTVEVRDWNIRDNKVLFVGIVQFDTEDMQLTIQPKDGWFDIDQFDLWNKAGLLKIEKETA